MDAGAAPGIPGPVTYDATTMTDTQVTISWGASAPDPIAGLDGYHVYVNGPLLATVPANVTTYDITGRASGESLNVAVYAFNSVGESFAPATLSVDLLVVGAPNPPTGLTHTTPTNAGAWTESWTASAVDATHPAPQGYRVFIDGLKYGPDLGPVTSVAITGQVAGTHGVKVKAFANSLVSVASARDSVTVAGTPTMYLGARGAQYVYYNNATGARTPNPNLGANASWKDYLEWSDARLGPGLKIVKMFYDGTSPLDTDYRNWGQLSALYDAGYSFVVSFKTPDPTQQSGKNTIAAFVQSLPSDRPTWITYWHEVEDSSLPASTFIQRFRDMATVVYANRGNKPVYTLYNAAMHPYGAASSTIKPGDYYPGDAYTDVITVDFYNSGRKEPAVAAQNDPWWRDIWYPWVKQTGKPWGITERGINNVHGTNSGNSQALTDEIDWMLNNGCYMYLYWDTSNDSDWNISSHPDEAAAYSAAISGHSRGW